MSRVLHNLRIHAFILLLKIFYLFFIHAFLVTGSEPVSVPRLTLLLFSTLSALSFVLYLRNPFRRISHVSARRNQHNFDELFYVI